LIANLWHTFVELVRTPFQQTELIWGIVPLYFGWLVSEITSSKATFVTAIQTGFAFVWAAARWIFPHAYREWKKAATFQWETLFAVNNIVTLLVLVIGLLALFSGFRRKYPKGFSFLGHSRFSSYFMIAIFPIQAHCFPWSWERLAAVFVFAVPIWIIVHFSLMPLRR
jgi:hypothetical protein